MDLQVALEALSTICNAKVTSVQSQRSEPQTWHGGAGAGAIGFLVGGAAVAVFGAATPMSTAQLVSAVLSSDSSSSASRSSYTAIRNGTFGHLSTNGLMQTALSGKPQIIDEEEFFDPEHDHDFTRKKDIKTFYRGDEVYQRPCGWYRFALKVLDKYDDNDWLGTTDRCTSSVPGEWPVSYHGTSLTGAEGIMGGHFKAGPRERYGRGVYSTPFLSEALRYSKKFESKKNGKTYQVIMQNRINPKYREIHHDGKYLLVRVPDEASACEEQEMVDRAIRPYGLLVKQV